MNNPVEIDNLLDDMLKNKTNRQDTEAFLRRQQVENPAFEIDLHIAAAKALQRYMVLEQVRLVHKDFTLSFQLHGNSIKLVKPRIMTRIVQVAAILILAVGGWLFYQYSTTNSTALYNSIYQPYHVNTERGIEDIITHNMVNDFKTGNFNDVIAIFESLPEANTREKFLAAYAYHHSTKYELAARLFNEIIAQNKTAETRLYNDEAEFYLALSYLKTNDIKAAVQLFDKIRSTPDHTFHERISAWTLTRLKWLQ